MKQWISEHHDLLECMGWAIVSVLFRSIPNVYWWFREPTRGISLSPFGSIMLGVVVVLFLIWFVKQERTGKHLLYVLGFHFVFRVLHTVLYEMMLPILGFYDIE